MNKYMGIVLALAILVGMAAPIGVLAEGVDLNLFEGIWTPEESAAFQADVDGGGLVDIIDLAIVASNLNKPFKVENIASYRSDVNKDRVVDLRDFWRVVMALGLSSPITWHEADFHGDGKVTYEEDFMTLHACLGKYVNDHPECGVANLIDTPGYAPMVETKDLVIELSFLRMPIPPEQIPDPGILFERMAPKAPKAPPEKMPPVQLQDE
ncbi:MAG: dockerin type I domain-containing protein [bacterium]|nr:dockerin type I domain-containing protein [bacterium]